MTKVDPDSPQFAENKGLARTTGRAKRFLREWLVPFALVLAVVTPLRAALADWYHVPSGSMRPTIVEGDRIFVANCAFGLRIPMTRTWIARWAVPERGDVVTLASPEDGTRLVKRVIGVPGDRIALRNNRLIVNGHAIAYVPEGESIDSLPDGRDVTVRIATEELPHHEHRVTFTPGYGAFRSFGPVVVPDGQYFVMGDNRDQSFDSRGFGFVPLENIFGRSSHVVLSGDPDRFYLPRIDRFLHRLD